MNPMCLLMRRVCLLMALMATAMMLIELVCESACKRADILARPDNRWCRDTNLNIRLITNTASLTARPWGS
jgi:hypothetical protein